jgi:hypothetical protein
MTGIRALAKRTRELSCLLLPCEYIIRNQLSATQNGVLTRI